MYNFRKNIILPIIELISKTDITKQYKFLKSSEFWSRDEIENYQSKKLKELFRHCYNNVQYYKNLFDTCNVNINSNNIFDEIKKLPILTKKDIIENYENLISKDNNNRLFTTASTGGSTGHPLKYLAEINTQSAGWASAFRGFEFVNYNVGDRIFTFSGSSLVKDIKIFSKQFAWERIIMNNYKYSSINISEDLLFNYHKKLLSIKPKLIRGYPSSIYIFAKFINDNNLIKPKLNCIFSTGEILLNEYKKIIEEVFDTNVYNGYGAGDGGFNSFECKQRNGMHITEENAFIEILKDGKTCNDGEIGNVIVTSLNNFVFPFIRYKVGDMAYIKKDFCTCGRNTKLIGEVIGRCGKVLYSKSGKQVSPTSLPILLYRDFDYHNNDNINIYNKIDKFQIYQDINGDLTIRLKLKENRDYIAFEYIENNFETIFIGSSIKIEFVDNIPTMNSGKEDYIISDFNYYL